MSPAVAKRKSAAAKPKPEPKAKAAPKTRVPRVPVAVKRLAEALELPDEASQCAVLHAQLAKVAKSKLEATAAAVLAHTQSGKPIARAYLTTLASPGEGPIAAADTIARYCAAIDRGRKGMRGAFVATWHRASEIRAVEDAYRNFSREIIDEPALLVVGVEAARQLGNQGAMAERVARLQQAARLAPLVKDLAGTATVRARAIAKLEAASADERRHVYARILEEPQRFPQQLAVAAVIALVDDPSTPDMSLAAAVADMREHGLDALVTAWQERVVADDDALINRLLALFEWTGLSATDAAQLEPFIRALQPVGRRPDVFVQVDSALTSEQPVVRQAVLETWLRPEGLAAFTDAQVDTLIRSAIAIAEEGHDTPDRRAANRVLHDGGHPGARKALMDAIEGSKTKRNDQLRANLYHGLSRLEHPTIVPFLVGRLFGEREQYAALMEALAGKLEAATHRTVLATLAARANDPDMVHAATVYADILVDKRRAPRLLVDLARSLAAAQPRTRDDGRRLRYVLEQATAGALSIHALDAARSFVARARDLPDKPYSDYWAIDRGSRTPAPFTEEDIKAQIAGLDAGTLDQELATARAAADAARKAGKASPADDARLGALAGCAVASRLLDDRAQHVVWFYDELGELMVYDGFSVAPPTFTVTGEPDDGMTDAAFGIFIAGKTLIDERISCFDTGFTRVREVIRIGDRMVLFEGAGEGRLELHAIGIKLAGYIAARDAVARFAASPPSGTRRADPWTRKGAVIRREYRSPAGSTARLAVIHGKIDGAIDDRFPSLERVHADAAAAGKALQVWEGKLFGSGGRLVAISLEEA